MYAHALAPTELGSFQPRSKRMQTSVPYCFILDDTYRVIMAGPSGGDDPLAPFYASDSAPDVLPAPIDQVVRALTAAWRSTRTASSASASVNDVQVTVAPLHGTEGRKIAVFVRKVESED